MADHEGTVEIVGVDQALAWGDEWQQRAMELERRLCDAMSELEIQRIFADDFAYAWEHAEEIQAAVDAEQRPPF